MPLVYIILINYNGYKDTIECIQSLEKISYKNFEIVVVDNASTNDSIIYIKKSCEELLKKCTIIESKSNLGFSGGNNLAIEYAIKNKAEYVLLLNNDTLVEPNFLDEMLNSFHKDEKIGIVGCKIMYYPQKNIIWYAGGKIDWFKFIVVHFGIGDIDKEQFNKEKEMDFMTGCCMLIKTEVFKKVGLLSNEYFMYFEDVDYCVKVRQANYKIWYNPKAVIYHKVGLSSGGEESSFSIKWNTRNRIIFMNKYRNKVKAFNLIISKMFFYSTRIIRYLQYIYIGEKVKSKAILEGIKEAWTVIKNK